MAPRSTGIRLTSSVQFSSVQVCAGRHSEKADINALEALTVLLALNAFNIKVPVHVRIDNTSALAAIRRGYSQGFRLNSVMQRLAVDDRSRFISSLQYIRSADNPSDGPSRLLQPQLVVNTGVVRGVFAAAAQLATTAVGVRGGTGGLENFCYSHDRFSTSFFIFFFSFF